MQTGRAFQIILAHPENAKETYHVLDAAQDCGFYFKSYAELYGESNFLDNDILNDEFKEIQLNTKARVRAYLEHDGLLSGGVYDLTPISKSRSQCDFNITKILKKQ